MELSALERLASLVRTAEVKAKSTKLTTEINLKSNRVIATAHQFRVVKSKCDIELPYNRAILAECAEIKAKIDQDTKNLLKYKSIMSPEEFKEAQGLVIAATDELKDKSSVASEIVNRLTEDFNTSEKAFNTAKKDYIDTKASFDQLNPGVTATLPECIEADSILEEVLMTTPQGRFAKLRTEVESTAPYYGDLRQVVQFFQMKVWIGRYRKLQEEYTDPNNVPLPTATEQNDLRGFFYRLRDISTYHQPGYIEAFVEGSTADWDVYVLDAQRELTRVTNKS